MLDRFTTSLKLIERWANHNIIDADTVADKSIVENASDISQCSCPPSCHQVLYDASVSSSMLSDMFIHTLLNRSFGPDIRRRYLEANDVHSRVVTDSMMETMRQLADLERTYESLSTVIEVDLLHSATSIVGDIYNAVYRVVQLTYDSVEQFRTRLIQPFTDTYEKKVDFFVRRIVNKAVAFLAHHASSNNGTFADDDVNSTAMEFCQHFSKFWRWFKYDYQDRFKATPYLDRKICSSWLLVTCRRFPNDMEKKEKKMSEQTKVWLKCMTEFRKFLDDADSWLKVQATLNSSVPLHTTTDNAVLVKLRNNTSCLKNTADSFRLHRVNKVWAIRANTN